MNTTAVSGVDVRWRYLTRMETNTWSRSAVRHAIVDVDLDNRNGLLVLPHHEKSLPMFIYGPRPYKSRRSSSIWMNALLAV